MKIWNSIHSWEYLLGSIVVFFLLGNIGLWNIIWTILEAFMDFLCCVMLLFFFCRLVYHEISVWLYMLPKACTHAYSMTQWVSCNIFVLDFFMPVFPIWMVITVDCICRYVGSWGYSSWAFHLMSYFSWWKVTWHPEWMKIIFPWLLI